MGKYKVVVKKSVYRELKKIPVSDLKGILNKIRSLSNDPRPIGCRKLFKSKNYRIRYRIYRIIYSIRDNVLLVFIVKVGYRREIYR